MSDVDEYRSAFGQPNHQELLRCLRQNHTPEGITEISKRVRVDLSLPQFYTWNVRR